MHGLLRFVLPGLRRGKSMPDLRHGLLPVLWP
jgi:hypothetical protein